jgi:hypothetical protein
LTNVKVTKRSGCLLKRLCVPLRVLCNSSRSNYKLLLHRSAQRILKVAQSDKNFIFVLNFLNSANKWRQGIENP